ncbi:hypothetical protein TcarDRAFT_2164 [Thermosinus carboxydivorans Nor1]|uniref:Uncharacterized protein n=1 Tax=Thermosinus carboxydivorans Nor1 TaxID=401526 RepID=A1HN66_9FIRM|nr:hypothetical protein [Thermosinus carboxydivorans]EAX48692.1 hypothetical protein TcarDRAFT_2164 [Thermosinus carboxydivorans Nor1]
MKIDNSIAKGTTLPIFSNGVCLRQNTAQGASQPGNLEDELVIGQTLKLLLDELGHAVMKQQELLLCLPPEIREQAAILLREHRQSTGTLQQGLAKVIQGQREMANKMLALAAAVEQKWKAISGEEQAMPAVGAKTLVRTEVEQEAARTLRRLATSLQPRFIAGRASDPDRLVLEFTLPLFFNGATKAYPVHIHIYHEQQKQRTDSLSHYETWLRVSMATEHLGIVTVLFRLYDKGLIELKVEFPTLEAAETFKEFVPEIRAGVAQKHIVLSNIVVIAKKTRIGGREESGNE